MFKVVGFATKPNDLYSVKVANEISGFLKKFGVTSLLNKKDIQKNAEMIIVLGGDGTFVGAARDYFDYDIPILGVNLGTLGFLTDINIDEVYTTIEKVLNGQFDVEERYMLNCTTPDGTEYQALNDVVVHRGNAARMVNADIFLNGRFVNNGSADGLIVCTPTGSTAYALSSGGPIMSPGVDASCLVYISPHAITYRPFIYNANYDCHIVLRTPVTGVEIIIDGQISIPFEENQKILVKKYYKPLKMIHSSYNYDFFNVLRNKLYWNK